MPNKSALGRWGEELASRYLRGLGMEILERNFKVYTGGRRGRPGRIWGEIDLIALDGEELVFAEVKWRRSALFSPLEAVTVAKEYHLRQVADIYLARQKKAPWKRVRFDVLALSGRGGEEIRHLRCAF